MQIRPRRSVLYMPGSNARALEKAKSIAADALILDLEDAVAPEAKETARAPGVRGREGRRLRPSRARHPHQRARHALGQGRPGGRRRGGARRRPAAQARHRRRHRARDGGAGTRRRARQDAAVGDDRDAARHPQRARHRRRLEAAGGARLTCFVLGTNDLVKETRADLSVNRRPALYWLSAALTAARAYGLDVLDGVYNNFKDADGYQPRVRARPRARLRRQDADPPRPGRRRQRGVRPAARPRWRSRARSSPRSRMPENKGKGVITVDGRMVELLHAEMAARTVAIAEAIERMSAA